jgi:predicted dehydrogenase
MTENRKPITRREFVAASTQAAAAAATLPLLGAQDALGAARSAKTRVALVGTGIRGTTMWGRDVVRDNSDRVELVGLCDVNAKRVEASKRIIGTGAPTFVDFDRMLREVKPDTVIVTTVDATHHELIIRALKFGCDVITEKPMTTDETKCRAILDAEKETGRRITVAFNYRFSARAEKVKELLMANAIGSVTSVDFHWYLDTRHGADYFRRWHAYKRHSGSLFVHKATHHFDLINWYLEADPTEVSAFGRLRNYGRNGTFRGRNCRSCEFKDRCAFHWDMTRDPRLMSLYAECESEDGYLRDACVYREDIDIYDTMTAQVTYSNGVPMSYSLNAFMPYEGHSMAFNGTQGRLEVRSYERQPWTPPVTEEIRLTRNFGSSQIIPVTQAAEGHGGADPRLRRMTFNPELPDPYRQRAGSRGGALSVLTGVAAVKSIESGKPVKIADLIQLS